MGFRGYLIKRTINTLILILFVIVLNFVIFELMPGQQGSIAALAQNPKIPQEAKAKFLISEETRLGIICPTASNPSAACPVWVKFDKYFMAMITFNFGVSFQTGRPVS